MSRLTSVGIFAILAARAFSQSSPAAALAQEQAIRVDVELVNLLATVRDKAGAFITDLTAADFTVLDDGKPAAITHFARQSDQPISVALLIDANWIARRQILDRETAAARQFFHDILRSSDRALIAGYANAVAVWQPLTSSQEALGSALDHVPELAPALIPAPPRKGPGPVMITIHCLGGARLDDATAVVAGRDLSPSSGRKAIVTITDGWDCGSQFTRRDTVQTAQKADVIVYGIHYSDNFSDLPGLKDLCGSTGGRAFPIDKKNTLGDAFAAIEAEIRNQYAIGFTPAAPPTAAMHKVELRVTRPGLTVHSRSAYFR
jgi:Ca-activated chloride channel family protein